MAKRLKQSEIQRFNEISNILGITFEEAQELSSVVTSTLKEIKKESENPHVNQLIHELAEQKSLAEAIE